MASFWKNRQRTARAIPWIASLAYLFVNLLLLPRTCEAQVARWLYRPEQRQVEVRDPAELPQYRLPRIPMPGTVARPIDDLMPRQLALDEAIRLGLGQAEVVRTLAGVNAVTTGRTVYDVSAVNSQIDAAWAQFDPRVRLDNGWNRSEPVLSEFAADRYLLDFGLDKKLTTGATVGLGVVANSNRQRPLLASAFDPLHTSSTQIGITQPLLQGFGREANLVPVVLARIDTERSFFQLKDSVQEMVRGVVEAYWLLVAARTDVWARQQQVSQAEEALRLADARFRSEINNAAEVAQARLTLANFRATLIAAQGNVLVREGALRNILGMPPSDEELLVPTSPPNRERIEPVWDELLELAAERRPDLIELKLVLEADQQSLVQANNQARPRMDAVALYRWNGFDGELPSGLTVQSRPGQYTDWTLGVNFSVPLGLRQARAGVRQTELLIARDRANLNQGLHAASHQLALSVRNLAQQYEQFLAYQEARAAARTNLNQQLAQYRSQRVIFLNVLQAITDWGNSITNEANALAQYNIQLATLERQTGTILETHGVAFYEERFGAVSPLGRWHSPALYPSETRPTGNDNRYPAGSEASENAFDLTPPATLRQLRQPPAKPEPGERLPAPDADLRPPR
ncbi:MAG: TolC family protein [Planctomycetota bacterium]